MATTFKVVRDFMRALLGDYGLEDPADSDYSDAALNQHINLTLTLMNLDELDSVEVAEVPASEGIPGTPADWSFTTELLRGQKALIALRASQTIVNNLSDEFAYKTPVHSVTRKGGVRGLRSFIETALANLEGRRLVFASQTDLEAILGYNARFLKDYEDAYSSASRI